MTDAIEKDELTVLKERADQMGIEYHPNIGVKKLKEKVNAAIEGTSVDPEKSKASKEAKMRLVETGGQRRQRLYQEANRLVRVVVSCNNPAKRDWEGEMFTVSNSVVGTLKKFVPFNNEAGFHVPQMLLTMIEERECLIHVNKKEKGQTVKTKKLIQEFNVRKLDALTAQELKDLAQRQAAANSIEQ